MPPRFLYNKASIVLLEHTHVSDDISLETLAAYASTAASADLSQLKPGKIDITIHADGQWSYRGSVFQRKAMVILTNLFTTLALTAPGSAKGNPPTLLYTACASAPTPSNKPGPL